MRDDYLHQINGCDYSLAAQKVNPGFSDICVIQQSCFHFLHSCVRCVVIMLISYTALRLAQHASRIFIQKADHLDENGLQSGR